MHGLTSLAKYGIVGFVASQFDSPLKAVAAALATGLAIELLSSGLELTAYTLFAVS